MPDQELTREALMAAVTPAELFGEAVGDALAVRRRYARWLKRFRPEADPEAFAHLRRLYEDAREEAVAGPTVEVPEAEASPLTPDVERLDPLGALRAALERRDWQAVVDLIGGDLDRLMAAQSSLVAHAAEVLMVEIGPHLGPGILDTLEILARRPDLDLHPARATELEEDVRLLRALDRAQADEAVPDALVVAMRRAWYRAAPIAAAAWAEAAEALVEVDLDELFAYLEEAHPELLTLAHRTELKITGAGAWYEGGTPPLDVRPQALDGLGDLGPVTWDSRWEGAEPRGVALWGLRGVAAAVTLLLLSRGMPMAVAVILGVVVWWVATLLFVLAMAAVALIRRRGIDAAAHAAARDPLLARCRAEGLFPHEVLSALIPEAAIPMDEILVPYPPGHALLELEMDRTALLRVIGPRHVARVEARTRAAAEGA